MRRKSRLYGSIHVSTSRFDPNSTLVVYNDRQDVVALLKNLIDHNASKHRDIQYLFVLDYVTLEKLGLELISTIDNISDEMSKCLAIYRFGHITIANISLRDEIGLTSIQSNRVRHKDGFGQSASTLSKFGFQQLAQSIRLQYSSLFGFHFSTIVDLATS